MSAFIVDARGTREGVVAKASPDKARADKANKKADKAEKKADKKAEKKAKAKATDAQAAAVIGDKKKSASTQVFKAAAAIVLGVLIGVGGFLAFFGGDDEPPTREISAPEQPFEPLAGTGEDSLQVEIDDWQAGLAASVECNALRGVDFEDSTIPTNFYADPANPGREQIVGGAGVDGSAALEIGDPGGAGTYGESIPVDGDTSYLFALNFNIAGDVPQAQVSIEWLDAARETIGESDILNLAELTDGQHALVTAPSPVDAAFGVARIHKAAGPGLLFVDELVFVMTESACTRDILS